MLDSGLEGSAFAILIALLGLAQAFVSQKQCRIRVYFGLHSIVLVVLLCVWSIPSSLARRQLALKLMLEFAWINGISIQLSSFQRIANAYHAGRPVFCYIAALTLLLHTLGFLLLGLGQGNGKTVLFGASLLIPFSLSVGWFYVVCYTSGIQPKPITIGMLSLLSICGFASLTAIQDVDKFLQANVILVSVTSFILVCIRFIEFSKAPRDIEFGPSNYPDSPPSNHSIKGTARTLQSGPIPSTLGPPLSQETRPQISLPPSPTSSTLAQFQIEKDTDSEFEDCKTFNSLSDPNLSAAAASSAIEVAILTVTEVHTRLKEEQDKEQPEVTTSIESNACTA